jgi:hypothetical protein
MPILTPDSEITPDESISVAAITTTFADPPPAFCVPLPWHPAGGVGTALKRRSAAVCNWVAAIHPADVVGYGGDVPTRVMDVIQRKIAELPTFLRLLRFLRRCSSGFWLLTSRFPVPLRFPPRFRRTPRCNQKRTGDGMSDPILFESAASLPAVPAQGVFDDRIRILR